MRITRQELGTIVAEEVRRRLRELVEFSSGDAEDSKTKKSKGKRPKTASADSDEPRRGPVPTGPKPGESGVTDPSSPEIDQDEPPGGPAVDGDQPDPEAEDDAEDDAADAVDPEGDSGEHPSGAVNDELSGKTIQAITIEPKSEVLPGAKEVVLAFNETTDPLRILVTNTGSVKFFWRGQLHDLP